MSKYEHDKTGVDDLYETLSKEKTYLLNKKSLTDESYFEYVERRKARESQNFEDSFVRSRFVNDFVGGREPFIYEESEEDYDG